MKPEIDSIYTIEEVLDAYLQTTKYVLECPKGLKKDRKVVKKMKKALNEEMFDKYLTGKEIEYE